MNATDLHRRLQVALAESWHSENREHRKKHAMQATQLANQLYRLTKAAEHARANIRPLKH